MTTTSTAAPSGSDAKPGWESSFGLFAPPLAWSVHLIAAALIAEWGCVAGHHGASFLGVTPVAWGAIAVTVITVLVAAAGTWVAMQIGRRRQGTAADPAQNQDSDQYLAHAGFLSGMLFLLVILAESVPILFFLKGC